MTSYTPQQPQHPPVGNTPTGGDFVEEWSTRRLVRTLMSFEEHTKVVNLVRTRSLPSKYKKTALGGYSEETVKQIITDALDCYREACPLTLDGWGVIQDKEGMDNG